MRGFPYLQTVRVRLMLWNMLVLALALLVLGSVLRVTVAHNLMASVDKDLLERARRAQNFSIFMAHRPVWNPPRIEVHQNAQHKAFQAVSQPQRQPAWNAFKPKPDKSVPRRPSRFPPPMPRDTGAPSQWQTQVVEKTFDLKGKRLFGPEKDHPLDWDAFSSATTGKERFSTVRINDEPVRVFAAPLRGKGQKIWGVVEDGYSLADVERAEGNLNTTLLTMLPVALAAVGIGGLFLTGKMLKPVREITCAAERIGVENLSERLPTNGSDEFSKLAVTFNAMLARLEQAFEQQRRFTADASHELRSPLTVIKSAASRAISNHDRFVDRLDGHAKAMQRIDKAADVMNRIVQDLLLLARADNAQLELELQPICLSELVETAIECVHAQNRAVIRNELENSAIMVWGDVSHLTRLFVNLLDNAVRYTPLEGRITISAVIQGNQVVIRVEDTGCGIAPEHLPHLCERFYRVDAARSRAQGGAGLGLAICQTIVSSHGGALDISSSVGVGTTVCVTLVSCSSDPPIIRHDQYQLSI